MHAWDLTVSSAPSQLCQDDNAFTLTFVPTMISADSTDLTYEGQTASLFVTATIQYVDTATNGDTVYSLLRKDNESPPCGYLNFVMEGSWPSSVILTTAYGRGEQDGTITLNPNFTAPSPPEVLSLSFSLSWEDSETTLSLAEVQPSETAEFMQGACSKGLISAGNLLPQLASQYTIYAEAEV